MTVTKSPYEIGSVITRFQNSIQLLDQMYSLNHRIILAIPDNDPDGLFEYVWKLIDDIYYNEITNNNIDNALALFESMLFIGKYFVDDCCSKLKVNEVADDELTIIDIWTNWNGHYHVDSQTYIRDLNNFYTALINLGLNEEVKNIVSFLSTTFKRG